ncbi:hypothetical protein BD777DRAFT_129878 [Yarrowia lipolytica]|nr:hypothetical protein BD777DRAFT_129878 [Yarrowia lipolytica]
MLLRCCPSLSLSADRLSSLLVKGSLLLMHKRDNITAHIWDALFFFILARRQAHATELGENELDGVTKSHSSNSLLWLNDEAQSTFVPPSKPCQNSSHPNPTLFLMSASHSFKGGELARPPHLGCWARRNVAWRHWRAICAKVAVQRSEA